MRLTKRCLLTCLSSACGGVLTSLIFRILLASIIICCGFAPLAEACSDAQHVIRTLAEGDWQNAEKLIHQCILEDRNNAGRPPQLNLVAISAGFWELAQAIVDAKLGRLNEASTHVELASTWAIEYGFDDTDMFPFADLADLTRGYMAERSNRIAEAHLNYEKVAHGLSHQGVREYAHARLGLLALDANDLKAAAAQATQGISEPTALYVVGVIAERQGKFDTALQNLQKAMENFYRDGVPFAIRFVDRDRIERALNRVRGRVFSP